MEGFKGKLDDCNLVD
jgi:hypothetical protein